MPDVYKTMTLRSYKRGSSVYTTDARYLCPATASSMGRTMACWVQRITTFILALVVLYARYAVSFLQDDDCSFFLFFAHAGMQQGEKIDARAGDKRTHPPSPQEQKEAPKRRADAGAVGKKLGEGTFARVYKYSNDTAVKMYKESRQEGVHGDAVRELVILGIVGAHPHVVELTEVCWPAPNGVGSPQFFMPRAESTLRQIIRRRDVEWRKQWLRTAHAQVWEGALRHLHAQGVAHRDVKPSNILVYYAGADADQPPHLRLADFGNACLVLRDGVSGVAERLTTCWTTYEYAPPEVLACDLPRDQKPKDGYDPRKTDAWSWGVVLGEIAVKEHVLDWPNPPSKCGDDSQAKEKAASRAYLAHLRKHGTHKELCAALPEDLRPLVAWKEEDRPLAAEEAAQWRVVCGTLDAVMLGGDAAPRWPQPFLRTNVRDFLRDVCNEEKLEVKTDLPMALAMLDQHVLRAGDVFDKNRLPTLALAALMLADKLLCEAHVGDWDVRIARVNPDDAAYSWKEVEKAEVELLCEMRADKGLVCALRRVE